MPADLPKPPAATLTKVDKRPDGLSVVSSRTATSLRTACCSSSTAAPAGYTLGRGDAEATEADVPFIKGGLRGVLRMLAGRAVPHRVAARAADGAGGSGRGTRCCRPAPAPSPLPFG